MSTLLFKTNGNKYMNRTMFRPFLRIYDDGIEYTRRNWFKVKQVSIPYTQISAVNVERRIFFWHFNIISASDPSNNINIRWIRKTPAAKAKKLIEQKVYQAQHNLMDHHGLKDFVNKEMHQFERSLQRLKELHAKGRISEKEFNKQRKHYISKMR